MDKVVIVTGTNSGLGNSHHLRTEHQRPFGKRICQTWCEGTYNDLENRWLESMPPEYIASYKPTYRY